MGQNSNPSPVDSLLENAGWVRAIARRLVLDPDLAEDVVQQTWVAALEKGPRSGVPLRPWLARVARNFSLKVLRGRRRRDRHEPRTAPRPPGPGPGEIVERSSWRSSAVRPDPRSSPARDC